MRTSIQARKQRPKAPRFAKRKNQSPDGKVRKKESQEQEALDGDEVARLQHTEQQSKVTSKATLDHQNSWRKDVHVPHGFDVVGTFRSQLAGKPKLPPSALDSTSTFALRKT